MSELNEIEDEGIETIKGAIGERISGACTYSYRVINMGFGLSSREQLEDYGAEGYRVVEVLGPDRNTLLLEKVTGDFGW